MNKDIVIVLIKTSSLSLFLWYFQRFREDIETRFEASNFEIYRPLPKGKNEKAIGLMKDELGEQIMKEFVGLRSKDIAI